MPRRKRSIAPVEIVRGRPTECCSRSSCSCGFFFGAQIDAAELFAFGFSLSTRFSACSSGGSSAPSLISARSVQFVGSTCQLVAHAAAQFLEPLRGRFGARFGAGALLARFGERMIGGLCSLVAFGQRALGFCPRVGGLFARCFRRADGVEQPDPAFRNLDRRRLEHRELLRHRHDAFFQSRDLAGGGIAPAGPPRAVIFHCAQPLAAHRYFARATRRARHAPRLTACGLRLPHYAIAPIARRAHWHPAAL